MSGLEKQFSQRLIEAVGDPLLYTPSIKLSVFQGGKVKFRWSAGEDYFYYDLASLTKIMFSAPLWMKAIQDLNISPHDPVQKYLSWWSGADGVRIKDLLTHSAGLTWWKPYYELIGQELSSIGARKKLKEFLANESPDLNQKRAVYSDLSLFYLGFLLEEVFQKDLHSLWNELSDSFGFKTLHFQDENKAKSKKNLYAPTGFSPFRQRKLVAEVHDDNAYVLGGVAPHAGLFGTLGDVESYLLSLREILKEGDAFGLKALTLNDFIQRHTEPELGDFGYLFMKPTKGSSSSGQYFDDSSFGHTGFTGTSIWYSPKKDIGVILLSNRTYYGSDVELFKNFRPLVHDLVMELLEA